MVVAMDPELELKSAKNREKGGISQFVGRMMTVLEAIQVSVEPPGLADIARRTRLPKSTVHRLLVKLVEHDVVRRQADCYMLGPTMWRLLEEGYPGSEFLRQAIKPVLVQLYSRTGYIAGLAVPDDSTVRFIDTVYDEVYLPAIKRIESSSLLQDSAAGKILLAYDRNLATGLVSQLGTGLERELSAIRKREIAIETGASISAVAIPVFDAERKPVAALSLGAYSDRFQSGLARAMLRRARDHVTLLTRCHAAGAYTRHRRPAKSLRRRSR